MSIVIEARPRLVYAEYGRTLVIRPGAGEDMDAFFDEVCANFGNTRIEQDSEGNVYIMAPNGGESADRNGELTMQLRLWAKQDGRGRALDSHALFLLPDKSRLGPDGCWVSNEKLASLSRLERTKFLPIVPEFIVELKSPSDRLSELQAKMRRWLVNGVSLAWLICPEEQYILVYRPSVSEAEMVRGSSISGEGPIAGFNLDLEPIWKGLEL